MREGEGGDKTGGEGRQWMLKTLKRRMDTGRSKVEENEEEDAEETRSRRQLVEGGTIINLIDWWPGCVFCHGQETNTSLLYHGGSALVREGFVNLLLLLDNVLEWVEQEGTWCRVREEGFSGEKGRWD